MAGALAAAANRAAGDAIPPDVDAIRRSVVWPAAGATMRATDLAMLYLMFNKPPLVESCVVVATVTVSFVVVELFRERQVQGARRSQAVATAGFSQPRLG
jgi:hypothetical protein